MNSLMTQMIRNTSTGKLISSFGRLAMTTALKSMPKNILSQRQFRHRLISAVFRK